MADFKSKAKKFWNDHKTEIIVFGATFGAVIGAGFISRKSYEAGFIDGGMTGVKVGAQWLDEKFPGESNAVALMERYALEHPEEIVNHKGPGKWS